MLTKFLLAYTSNVVLWWNSDYNDSKWCVEELTGRCQVKILCEMQSIASLRYDNFCRLIVACGKYNNVHYSCIKCSFNGRRQKDTAMVRNDLRIEARFTQML